MLGRNVNKKMIVRVRFNHQGRNESLLFIVDSRNDNLGPSPKDVVAICGYLQDEWHGCEILGLSKVKSGMIDLTGN